MGTAANTVETIQRACTKVSALVTSRLLRRDLRDEVARLESATPQRARAEVALVLAGLFGLAVFAASFGVLGMAAFFVSMLVIFH